MKKLILLLVFSFCLGSLHSSNLDDDVGTEQTTTLKIEAEKHQLKINEGWKFQSMTIKEVPNGIYLIVEYEKKSKVIKYTSPFLLDYQLERKPERRDKYKPKIVFNTSGGNPGWRC